jgi:hypothetical protein
MGVKNNIIGALISLFVVISCADGFEKECVGTYVLKQSENLKTHLTLELKSNHSFNLNSSNHIINGIWEIENENDFTLLKLIEKNEKTVHELYYGKNQLLILNPILLIDSSISNDDLFLVKIN